MKPVKNEKKLLINRNKQQTKVIKTNANHTAEVI